MEWSLSTTHCRGEFGFRLGIADFRNRATHRTSFGDRPGISLSRRKGENGKHPICTVSPKLVECGVFYDLFLTDDIDMHGITFSFLTLLLVQDVPVVPLSPRFEPGTSLELEIQHSREDPRSPSLGTSITTVLLRTLQSEAGEAVVEWTYGKNRLTAAREPTRPTIQLATNWEGMRIEIVVRQDGSYRIRNAEEVSAHIQADTERMIETALLTFPEPQKEQLARTLRTMITPDIQMGIVMKDVWLCFALYGLTPRLGVVSESPSSVPYRLNSRSVDSLRRTTLQKLDTTSATALVHIEQTYTPETSLAIATEANRQSSVQQTESGAQLKGSVRETINLTYRTTDGYFDHLVQEIEILQGSFKRVDRTEISVVGKTGPK